MSEQLKCVQCQIMFPMKFYAPTFAEGRYHDFCPECARNFINSVHGLPQDTPFRGSLAKQNYDEFIEWKESTQ